MKNKILTTIIALGLFLLNSCDNQDGFNDNTKAFEKPIPEALMTSAQIEYANFFTNINANTNNFRQYAQFITGIAYPNESRYDVVSRNISQSLWVILYRDVLKDLIQSKKLISETSVVTANDGIIKKNKLAIIEVQIVAAYQTLVDLYGNVPYTESLDDNIIAPKYDDAKTIYLDLIKRINAAILSMDTTKESFEEGDIVYNGNVEHWKKFANSIKLKLGMHMADVDASLAKTIVEAAVQSGLMGSNADNAIVNYQMASPYWNPMYEDLTSRDDFVIASTFSNELNHNQDPRRDVFFNPASKINGEYLGAPYGSGGDFEAFSHMTEDFKKPNFKGVLFDYAETNFFLADAANRGFNVGGSAADFYKNGIAASMEYWGVSAANADNYLARTDVAFATATGTTIQKIAKQMWIAYYNRGFEAWTEFRRLDFPALVAPANAEIAAGGKVPARLTYSHLEPQLNGANYNAAATAIGGDKLTTKIFWDLH